MPEAIDLRKLISEFNLPIESGNLGQWSGQEKEALILKLGDNSGSERTQQRATGTKMIKPVIIE